jgi:hypothetical protein
MVHVVEMTLLIDGLGRLKLGNARREAEVRAGQGTSKEERGQKP